MIFKSGNSITMLPFVSMEKQNLALDTGGGSWQEMVI
jgi:hypothetical protein